MHPVSPYVPAATLSVEFQVVGQVTHRCSNIGVVAVKVAPGGQIEIDDTLLGITPGSDSGPNSRTIRVTSLQLNHSPIQVGEGGQEIGILIGHPLFLIGSVVYRVLRISKG